MTKWVKFFGWRLAVSFLVVIIIAYGLFIRPQQNRQNIIKNHLLAVTNMDESLQTARQRLKDTKLPSIIIAGQAGAQNYAAKLATDAGAFSTQVAKIPKTINNATQARNIAQFNALVKNPDYKEIIRQSGAVLSADQQLLSHQAQAMKILADFLEYNPSDDVSSTNSQFIVQNLSAANDGISRDIDKLESINNVKYDPTLGQITKSLQGVVVALNDLSSGLTGTSADTLKSRYINTVKDSQKLILANRAQYWNKNYPGYFRQTDQAEKTLAFYLKILRALQP